MLGKRLKTGAVPCGIGVIGQKRPFVKGQRGIGHHQLKVEMLLMPQSGTFRAGAVRVVKRKKARLQIRHRNTAIRARIFLRKEHLCYRIVRRLLPQRYQSSAGAFQRGLYRLRKSFADIGGKLNTIHDNLYRVFFLLIELNAVFQINGQSVDARTEEACLLGVFDNLLVLALLALDNGREDLNTGMFFPAHNRIDNLINGLLLNFFPALRTMRMPRSGI